MLPNDLPGHCSTAAAWIHVKANEWGETGRPLLTDEQVEFQKPPAQVQDFREKLQIILEELGE